MLGCHDDLGWHNRADAGMRAGMTDPTRSAALDLLISVLDRGRPLEEALDALRAKKRALDAAAVGGGGPAPAGGATGLDF